MTHAACCLHPQLLESPAWKDQNLWRLWCWCHLCAARKARTAFLDQVPVRLAPGQAAASLEQISQVTGLSLKAVRASLEIGKTLGLLDIRATPWGLRITIVNWQ